MKRHLKLYLVVMLGAFSATNVKAEDSLVILHATYGGKTTRRDVTSLLQSRVKNAAVLIEAKNSALGGDPVFGEPKTLEIQYWSTMGEYALKLQENDYISLNASSAEGTLVPEAPPTDMAKPTMSDGDLAPRGIFYVIERVKVMTDTGVLVLPSGTKVTQLDDATEGKLKVSDGTRIFYVNADQVTNDMRVARKTMLVNEATVVKSLAAMAAEREKTALSVPTSTPAEVRAAQIAQIEKQRAVIGLKIDSLREEMQRSAKGSTSSPNYLRLSRMISELEQQHSALGRQVSLLELQD